MCADPGITSFSPSIKLISNISIQSNTAMIIISAGDTNTVMGVSAGNNTILILGQASIATIRVLANTYRIQFDPMEDKKRVSTS
jgi:hypothetical protein